MTEEPKKDHVIEFCWHGPRVEAVEEQMTKEIRETLDGGLTSAQDLMFHQVFLGEGPNTPVILIWGEENDHRFHCEYKSEPDQSMKFDLNDFPELKEQLDKLRDKE